jgi:tripartite-type tricarboxylate transporter receptor subunit TctC
VRKIGEKPIRSFANNLAACATLGVVIAGPLPALAAGYPDHAVKVIVPFAAGGPTDVMARLIAQKLSESLKQQFYVEDHAGAGGNIGIAQAARSAPDGYTILVASSSFMVNPSLYAQPPFDALKDFAPVTRAAATPNILVVVHPSIETKNMKDLIALMKASPGSSCARAARDQAIVVVAKPANETASPHGSVAPG